MEAGPVLKTQAKAIGAYVEQQRQLGKDVSNREAPELAAGISKAFRGYLPVCSVETEVAAWALIKAEVEKLIASYPTTFKQDMEIL